MNKIKPFNDDDFIETKYSDDSSNESHIINLKEMPKKINKWCRLMSYFYDISLDNLPMGSIIGLVITITATCIISYGISSSEKVINKYNSTMGSYITYHVIGLSLFILIHLCVLIHGISICILETSREWCGRKEVGCFCGKCKNKNTNFGKNCRICQNVTRKGIQMLWAVLGTILLLVLYVISIGAMIFSSITTVISYILKISCTLFSYNVNNLRLQAISYLSKAKMYHNYTDNMMTSMLNEYNNWVNIKDSFVESGLGQVENITSTIYYPNPKVDLFIEGPKKLGRQLTETFNPLTNGKSLLETFNTSIYQTELQLDYYTKQYEVIEEFCFDYASIYDNLYIISIGILCLLFSQLIMFSVHYKYFSTWNYELKLLNLSKKKTIFR